MTTDQMRRIQEIVTRFLNEQLILDDLIDQVEAQKYIEENNGLFDRMIANNDKDPKPHSPIEYWQKFFEDNLYKRVEFYDLVPEEKPSSFCDALKAAHSFLWQTLIQSSLKPMLDEIVHVAQQRYYRFSDHAFLRNDQEDFEAKRFMYAALNHEDLLALKSIKFPDKAYEIKQYRSELHQTTFVIKESIDQLKGTLEVAEESAKRLKPIKLSPTTMLIDMQKIVINFLEESKAAGTGFNTKRKGTQDLRNVYLSQIRLHFSHLIQHQTEDSWTALLRHIMHLRISVYTETSKTKSTFGDALTAAHKFLIDFIDKHSQENSVLASLQEMKKATHKNYRTLLKSSPEDENTAVARINSAALGNEEDLEKPRVQQAIKRTRSEMKTALPLYPTFLYQSNERVTAGIKHLQQTQLSSSRDSVFSHCDHTENKSDSTHKKARFTYSAGE